MHTNARTEDAALLIRQRAGKSPLLVAVDGHNPGCRTAMTRLLQRMIANVSVVRADDFCRAPAESAPAPSPIGEPPEHGYDWRRLEAQVLAPLARGQAARYQKADLQSRSPDVWAEVPASGVVLVEVALAATPDLRGYFDLVLYVDAAPGEISALQPSLSERAREVRPWSAANAPKGLPDLVLSVAEAP